MSQKPLYGSPYKPSGMAQNRAESRGLHPPTVYLLIVSKSVQAPLLGRSSHLSITFHPSFFVC